MVSTGLLYAAVFMYGALAWRRAVVAALVLAVFEGALRKWVFPEHGQIVYLVKDVLLLGAYAGFWAPRVLRREPLFDRHPANLPLALLGLVLLLQLLNPLLPNLALGLFGIRAYLAYMPLLFLVPAVFPDAQALRRFWRWYLLLALGPLALGLVQFTQPPDSPLNRYAWEDELGPGVAGFAETGRVRVTGTFSYLTGFTSYLLLVILMALSVVAFEPKGRLRQVLYGLLALAVVNLLMTGSRGPFLIIAAALPALLLLAGRARARGRVRAIAALCVAVGFSATVAVRVFPEATAAFAARARESADVPERLVGIVRTPLLALADAGLGGYGVGTTHQARAFLVEDEIGALRPPDAEGEWERVILELGPVGFLLTLLARLMVSRQLWSALRAAGGTPLAPYLVGALLFSLASIPGPLVFNHTAALFYWFLAGCGLVQAQARAAVRVPFARMAWTGRAAPGFAGAGLRRATGDVRPVGRGERDASAHLRARLRP